MEAIEALERSPLFSGLKRGALKDAAAALVMESWPKKCEIPMTGEAAGRFRMVVKGRVKISRSHPHSARELTLWLLGPGDVFDVASLLDGKPHAVSACAIDDVQTLSGPISAFQEWLDRYPPLRLAVCRYVARQLRELIDLAGDHALHDTMTRLARLLVRHFVSPQDDIPKANLIHDLPQEELASMIGSVRVVVSRLLAQMRAEGVVSLRSGALGVLDLKRLLHRAQAQLRQHTGKVGHPRAARG
jgi:CRP-like cAMP-binding protein